MSWVDIDGAGWSWVELGVRFRNIRLKVLSDTTWTFIKLDSVLKCLIYFCNKLKVPLFFLRVSYYELSLLVQ